MDEKTLRALVSAGAIKRIHIIGEGALLHVVAESATGAIPALTGKGAPKTWRTLDAAAKWIKGLGMGSALLDLSRWQPDQRELKL